MTVIGECFGKGCKYAMPRWLLPCSLLMATIASAQAPRMVLIDQDGSGPGGSNQMAMMVLLQSPQVKVLGITMVSGNAWEPEEVQHTLRMLELIHRTDVPVVPGAVFPLLRTEAESMKQTAVIGSFPWYGAWGTSQRKRASSPIMARSSFPLSKRASPLPSLLAKTPRTSSFARSTPIRMR
jgi:hypothetical protein